MDRRGGGCRLRRAVRRRLLERESTSSSTEGTQPPGTFGANDTNEDAGPPQSGGALAFGLAAETDGWDPSNSRWGGSGYIVGFSIFDPLAAYGEDLKVHPYLARASSTTPTSPSGHRRAPRRHLPRRHAGRRGGDRRPLQQAKGVAAHRRTMFDFADTLQRRADGTSIVVSHEQAVVDLPRDAHRPDRRRRRRRRWPPDPNAQAEPRRERAVHLRELGAGAELKVKKNPNYWRKGLPYLDGIEFQIV